MASVSLRDLGIDRLSIEERLQVADAIWDSVMHEVETSPLPEWQRAELERRLAESRANPDAVRPWSDVEAEALARVPRRVARVEFERAHLEGGARRKRADPRAGSERRVLHPRLRRAFRREIRGHCVVRHERGHAAHEVGVDMGLGDGDDAQSFFRGDRQVAIDVASGIDDDRLARRRTADEVRGLREGCVIDPAEKHRVSLSRSTHGVRAILDAP